MGRLLVLRLGLGVGKAHDWAGLEKGKAAGRVAAAL